MPPEHASDGPKAHQPLMLLAGQSSERARFQTTTLLKPRGATVRAALKIETRAHGGFHCAAIRRMRIISSANFFLRSVLSFSGDISYRHSPEQPSCSQWCFDQIC